jgi:hypothetical protein
MMMGSTTVTSAGINDALTLVNAMLDPQQAKRGLEELAQRFDELDKKQAEVAALQKQASDDRAAADKLKAELDAHAQDLATREQAHNAALSEFTVVHDKLSSDMAAHDANRKTTSDDLTRREVAIAAREAAVEASEQRNVDEAATLETMRKDLEDRLAKIRSFVA